jgi:hypothetical protein
MQRRRVSDVGAGHAGNVFGRRGPCSQFDDDVERCGL